MSNNKIKIEKLDGDYKYLSLILRNWVLFPKICKLLKTSIWDYEKNQRGDISFLLHKLTVHT